MNSYALNLSGYIPAMATVGGLPNTVLPKLLKTLSYVAIYAKNVNFNTPSTPNTSSAQAQTVAKCPSITFDLEFSLSNISQFFDQEIPVGEPANGTDLIPFLQLRYDTSKQSTLEMVDKPYPVKGLLAVVMSQGGGAQTPVADLDNYQSMNVYVYDPVSDTSTLETIYIGVCNSSQTEFYTPFINKASGSPLPYVIASIPNTVKR